MEFESSLYTVSEGSAYANITIIKTGSNDVELRVAIRTSDGNATGLVHEDIILRRSQHDCYIFSTGPNDYDPTEDQVIFGPTGGQQTVSIAINDDQVLEGSESFFVTLSVIDNQRGVQLGLSDAQIIIVDNDG